jgi:hypothetical protein
VPLAAFGDAADGAPAIAGPTEEQQELLEVREAVQEVNEFAQEEAPAAVGSTCRATLEVEGIGDTCVAEDGLLRVEQADGRSHTIHGLDAPPIGAAAFAPTSQAAVNGAGVDDVACVGTDQPHFVLVYARPGNVASRYSTIAPLLQREVYKVSAFIDSESRSVDPAASRRLPMRCDGGTPVVLQATLNGLTAGSASFSNIVDGLRAQGYQFNGDGDGKQRYIVYYDSPSPTGAAGTGHVFTSDSSAGAGNQNNKGGLYAVEYRFDNGGSVPHWEVLIHEVIHTMGAVVNDAANASGAGHCTDGEDIMCYQDTQSTSYDPGVCGTKVLDCNRDDYFNPSPPAGSFLSTHWNAAASYNAWLSATGGGGAPPANATGIVQTGASNSTVGIAWTATPGAASYAVSVREPGGAWRQVVITTRTSASIGGLAAERPYEVAVASRAANGTAGEPGLIAVATSATADTTAPARPGVVRSVQRSGSVTLTWTPPTDDVGVMHFELRQVTRTTRGRTIRAAGRTPDTSFMLKTSKLRPGSSYLYEVIARDASGNASPARAVTVRIARDRIKPSRPGWLRAAGATRSSVSLTWAPSSDAGGLAGYVVTQQVGSRWVRIGRQLPASRRAINVVGLRARSTYVFRVQGVDTSGNLSAASSSLSARTR